MNDFQDLFKRIVETDEMEPIGAPEKFHIGHHQQRMDKNTNASEILKSHLEAQAFEFQKLKKSYDELVAGIQQVMGGMGSYGIEDKGFMKGQLQPMQKAQQGQVSDPSQAQAMAAAGAFRSRLNTPVSANTDDI